MREPFARSPTSPCQALIEYVAAGHVPQTAAIDFVCHAATLWDREDLERAENMLHPQ
ncbi:hypothetical protein METHP14_60066 [Pseudomonas sp. P14-2025]